MQAHNVHLEDFMQFSSISPVQGPTGCFRVCFPGFLHQSVTIDKPSVLNRVFETGSGSVGSSNFACRRLRIESGCPGEVRLFSASLPGSGGRSYLPESGSIRIRPVSLSSCFCMALGSTVTMTSNVGNTCASITCPPRAVPSGSPTTMCVCTTGLPW